MNEAQIRSDWQRAVAIAPAITAELVIALEEHRLLRTAVNGHIEDARMHTEQRRSGTLPRALYQVGVNVATVATLALLAWTIVGFKIALGTQP